MMDAAEGPTTTKATETPLLPHNDTAPATHLAETPRLSLSFGLNSPHSRVRAEGGVMGVYIYT